LRGLKGRESILFHALSGRILAAFQAAE